MICAWEIGCIVTQGFPDGLRWGRASVLDANPNLAGCENGGAPSVPTNIDALIPFGRMELWAPAVSREVSIKIMVLARSSLNIDREFADAILDIRSPHDVAIARCEHQAAKIVLPSQAKYRDRLRRFQRSDPT